MSDAPSPFDCTIVGAGPAGVSAALWAETYDLEYRWLDRDGSVGGMLERVENGVDDYVGGNFENGRALRRAIRSQVDERDEFGPQAATVEHLERCSDHWRVRTNEDNELASKTVVLATGTRYRRLDVPGEKEGLGTYVSQSTSRDANKYGGRTVAIVGGGDAGFEGALQLATAGSHVHLLLRSEPTRARPQFVEPVVRHPHIFVHPIPTTVERIESIPSRRSCRLHLDRHGRRETMEVGCLFVRIGVEPVYPAIEPMPETDPRGHIVVDRRQRTNCPGLFAAGDVTDTPLPSVAVSVGGGAKALFAAADRLGLA